MNSAGKRRQSARLAQKSRTSNTSGQGPSTSGEGRPPDENNPPVYEVYECPICRESTRKSNMTSLPCYHVFHRACINRWLSEDTRCPVCRKETEPARNVSPPQDNTSRSATPLQHELHVNPNGINVRFRGNNPSMIRIHNGEISVWPPNSFRTVTDDDFSRRLHDASRRLGAVSRSLDDIAFRSYDSSRRVNEDMRTVNVGAMNGGIRMSVPYSMRGNNSGSTEYGNFNIAINGVNIHIS